MRYLLTATSFAAVVLLACGSRAELADPRTLYTVEATATPAAVKAGESGTFKLVVRPKAEAHVKPETPFKGKLSATGLELSKSELAFRDARVEGTAPVFEIPFRASAAGDGAINADLTFFVCIAEACLRTTEKLSVPVKVAAP